MSGTPVATPTEYTVRKISPMLAVEDMQHTLAFYRNVLGFTVMMESAEYSIVERNRQTIHFMKAASEEVMRCVRGHAEIYIEVAGIDSLWEQVKLLKATHHIRDLFDRPYGMTEFHIEDPNGCLVFVGEPTSARNRTGHAS